MITQIRMELYDLGTLIETQVLQVPTIFAPTEAQSIALQVMQTPNLAVKLINEEGELVCCANPAYTGLPFEGGK